MTDIPERWTRARVYPDMWTDPGQDPRNSDGVSPDGELATLRDYVRGYRLTLVPAGPGPPPGRMRARLARLDQP